MKKNVICLLLASLMACSFGACSYVSDFFGKLNGDANGSDGNGSSVSNSMSSDALSSGLQSSEDLSSESVDEDDVLTVTIKNGTGEVYTCIEGMQKYLTAPSGTDVAKYAGTYTNQEIGVKLQWACSKKGAESYLLEYGVKSESEKTQVTLDGKTTSYELHNLLKATEYEWSVTVTMPDGETYCATESFTTSDNCPRVLVIDGICNTRDMGGYLTASGKRTKQGMIYRGGSLLPADIFNTTLSAEGKKYMSEVLGIKTDFDLRGKSGLTESPIPGATLMGSAIDGYASAFSNTYKEAYRQVFSAMAKRENYPMYIHCTGGADRTGTIAFLFNALLGVSERDLIVDYETTSFSVYGTRSTQSGTYADPYFKNFYTQLQSFEGETLSEKTEKYMLSIGVTQEEIDNIRLIMFGE